MPIRTAYVNEQARRYDQDRFLSSAGQDVGAIEMAQFVAVLAEIKPGARILEVGCGTGRFLVAAHNAGMRCEGVDPSPDMLEQVRLKAGNDAADLRLTVAEGRALPYPGGEFDLVYSIRVLNQTESPEYALAMVAEMLRVTREGGHVLVEFANLIRPRRSGETGVRLQPVQVIKAASNHNGRLIRLRGAFLLGMTAHLRAPAWLRPALRSMDASFSRGLPRLCARCYALFQKTNKV